MYIMSKKLQNQSIDEFLGLPPKVSQVPKIDNIYQRPTSRRGRNFEETQNVIRSSLIDERSGNNSSNCTTRTHIQSKSNLEFVNFDEQRQNSFNSNSVNPSICSEEYTSSSSSSSSSKEDTSMSSDSIKSKNSTKHSKTPNIPFGLTENNEKNDNSAFKIRLERNSNVPAEQTKQTTINEEKDDSKLPGKNLIKKVIKPHSASIIVRNPRLSQENINTLKLENLNNNIKTLQRGASVSKYDISQENKNDNLQRSKVCYEAWLERKNLEIIRKREEGILAKKKEEEEKQIKMQTSLKIFEKWKSDYEEKMREDKLKKKHQREEEYKKKEEEAIKRKEAEKMFLAWKNEHETRLKEKLKKDKEDRISKERIMEDEKKNKLNESKKAFETWKSQKEKEIEENKRINKDKLALLKKRKKDEKEFKDAIAKEAFEIWLTMKEQENEYKKSLAYKIEKFEEETRKKFKIPWIPASNTIPKSITDRLSRSSHSLSRPKSGKNERGSVRSGPKSSNIKLLNRKTQTSSSNIKRTKSVTFLPWR
uniref:Microtubule-associated protein 9 n=1 Tax=Strongyloides papillosus TaxID=174720 RepID=A0A0N5BBX1_STREA